jgi:hypothetical protein
MSLRPTAETPAPPTGSLGDKAGIVFFFAQLASSDQSLGAEIFVPIVRLLNASVRLVARGRCVAVIHPCESINKKLREAGKQSLQLGP